MRDAIRRVAAIDCGTNSLRLLVADVDPVAGTLVEVERRTRIVRLGQDVDRTGRLAPEALDRALATTREYAERVAELGARRVRFVATSATRDASNRDEFVRGVLDAVGVEPEVVSGDEEARLSFHGATRRVAGSFPAPYVVVDIGGGSTEIVLGDGELRAAMSLDVGCVRLTERHLRSDPPTAAERVAARADVRVALDRAAARVPLGEAATLVGVAGSITSITAHVLGLPRYDPRRIDGAVSDVDAVLTACEDLLGRSRAQRATLGFMEPGRVDVIGAGALIWAEVIRRVCADVRGAGRALDRVVTSEHDILDGIAASLATGPTPSA